MRFVQGIVYRADGSVKSSYTMPSEADIYAQANAGETAYPVPLGTLDSLPYDLTALRDQKKQEINDAAAEYGPGVEAARMSAIQAIDEAETIPAIFAAASVDWEAALSSPPEKRSEEHTSELQSLMRISYAVFCLK